MVTIFFGYRLHNQLTSKHGLTGDMWKGARLELLDIAKRDDIDEEDEALSSGGKL